MREPILPSLTGSPLLRRIAVICIGCLAMGKKGKYSTGRKNGDYLTMEIPGLSRPPGRPVTGLAMSGAQRSKKYRKGILEEGGGYLSGTALSPAAAKALEELREAHPGLTMRELIELVLIDAGKRWAKPRSQSDAQQKELFV